LLAVALQKLFCKIDFVERRLKLDLRRNFPLGELVLELTTQGGGGISITGGFPEEGRQVSVWNVLTVDPTLRRGNRTADKLSSPLWQYFCVILGRLDTYFNSVVSS